MLRKSVLDALETASMQGAKPVQALRVVHDLDPESAERLRFTDANWTGGNNGRLASGDKRGREVPELVQEQRRESPGRLLGVLGVQAVPVLGSTGSRRPFVPLRHGLKGFEAGASLLRPLCFLTERHFFLRLGDSLSNRDHRRLHVVGSCLFVAAPRRQTQGRLGNKKPGLDVLRNLIRNR